MLSVLSHRLNKLQSYSLPSNSYVDLTFGANGSKYTAPADGYFTLSIRSASSNVASVHIQCNNIGVQTQSYSSGIELRVFTPAKKNDYATIWYQNVNISSLIVWRFYYTIGSAPQT